MGETTLDPNPDFQQEPTFRDLVALLRRGLVFALAVAIGATVLTYVLTKRVHPTYRASATILASQPDNALQQFGVSLVTAPTVDVTAYQAAATSTPVVARAMQSLGNTDPSERSIEELVKSVNVRVDSSRQSSLLHINVKSNSPAVAAATANALSDSLLDWDKERATRNLQNIVQALQGQISSLDAQIGQVQTSGAVDRVQLSGLQNLRAQQALQLNAAKALENSAVGNLEVLEPAVVPIKPVAPRPGRDSALAFVLGVFLVYGLVLLRDALDTRFRGTDDLARTSRLPVLAEFPRLPAGTRHLPREASNYLRTNVLFGTSKDHPKVILVTSSGPSEGKTSVAMSLAESFARNDYQTLLIDADLRKPTIGKEYSLSGLTDAPFRKLLEDPELPYDPVSIDLDHAELHVIPSFAAAPSPTELLTYGFSKVLNRLKNDYDVIVVDSPPVLPVADAMTMAPHCTGVIFPVSLPNSDRRRTEAGLGLLERIGVRLLGVVATNLEKARNGQGEYGYGYGYGYGTDEAKGELTTKPSTALGLMRRQRRQSRTAVGVGSSRAKD